MIRSIVVVICAICLFPLAIEYSTEPNNNGGNVLDVIIIDGQSNAAYPLDLADPEVVDVDFPNAPSKKLLYYGTASAPVVYSTFDSSFESYSLHEMWDGDSWAIGGYEPGLASTIAKRNGHDVLIINIGVAGASVSELMPSSSKGEYGVAIINHALQAVDDLDRYDGVNMLGWVWAQGEADALTSIPDYIRDFKKIDDYMESIGAKDCYIIETRLRWGNSVAAQNDLIHSHDDIYLGTDITLTFTVADGTLMPDNTHYTQKGRDIIAEDVGESIQLPEKENAAYTILSILPIIIAIGIVIASIGIIYLRRE